jgi:DNA polymerase-3 subunit gamma/tau
VIELDAASNNGVDDIRDIIAGAWHGTPGTWKVYIFDEVHQLSKAASAALLKTLEEPPSHVVFVLATTDPHKVLPTIRSRTQHLEFRLIGAETLATLLRDVEGAAGLDADESTIEAAVRLGRGSARDALSALDQLIATGSISEVQPEFDGLFHALVHNDAVEAIRSLAVLAREGWDPEQLAENFAGEVRQVFLLQVAPEVADAVDADRDRLVAWGEQLGLARTVRVLETVGRAIREMKSAPEKIVMLEVAMVRLTKPELDSSYESLDERLTKIERGAGRASAPAPTPPTPELRPIGSTSAPSPIPATVSSEPAVSESTSPEPTKEVEVPATSGGESLLLNDVRQRFTERVIPRTSRAAQLLLRAARIESMEGLLITIAVPSEEMRQNTELISQGLKGALEHEFKAPLTIYWTVDTTLVAAPMKAPVPSRATAKAAPVDDDPYGVDESVLVVDSVADHLITEMFPGAEEIS